MNHHGERMTSVVKLDKLDLKHQCQGQVYVSYSDTYIFIKGAVTAANTAVQDANRNDGDKK